MLNEKEILDEVEQSFYTPVYEKENMTSRVDRENNYIELSLKLASSPRKLAMLNAIKLHLSNLRLPTKELIDKFYVSKAHAQEILETNTLDITPEFAYHYNVIDPTNYSEKKKANYEARQLCKTLVKAGVLHNIKTPKTKDRYLVNPLYIYFHKDSSCKFGTVYLQWCECKGITVQPNDKYLKGVYNKKKLSTGRPVKVDDPITASYKQQHEEQQLINRSIEYTDALQDVKQKQQQRSIEEEHQYQVSLAKTELSNFIGKDPQRWIDTYTTRNIPFDLLPDHIKPYVEISSSTEAIAIPW